MAKQTLRDHLRKHPNHDEIVIPHDTHSRWGLEAAALLVREGIFSDGIINVMHEDQWSYVHYKIINREKLEEPVEYYGMPEEGWTCFFCGENFRTVGGARDHFGDTLYSQPGCIIKVEAGDERGWLMKIRELEMELERLRSELWW